MSFIEKWMTESDQQKERDTKKLQKIANNGKIKQILEKYHAQPDNLENILHLLMASGFGKSSWSIIEKPKKLEEYLKMEANGLEFPEIISRLLK